VDISTASYENKGGGKVIAKEVSGGTTKVSGGTTTESTGDCGFGAALTAAATMGAAIAPPKIV